MSRFVRLELARYQRTMIMVAVTAGGSLLVALYFFAIVGRFDDSADSAMFGSHDAVIALSFTVALCVMAIYGSVIYARFVVSDYIGNRRVQLYSYPGGRSPLFLAKNAAFVAATVCSTAAGFSVATFVFFVTELVAPIVGGGGGGLGWIVTALTGATNAVLLAASVALVAGVIGIRRQSTVSAVVAAIIVVALLGNGVAVSLNSSAWLSWVISVAGVCVAVFLVSGQSRRIRVDEVL